MKYIIDKTEFDKLDDAAKAFYEEQDDGSYKLHVEGLEDTGALKRAKDHEKAQRKEAEKQLRELKEQFETLQEEITELRESGGKGKGKKDETELDKSWQAKYTKRENELQEQINQLEATLSGQAVDSVANRIASELAGDNAHLMLPHVKSRLKVEMVKGKPEVKVLDEEGSVSAFTHEELQKEFLSNQKFSTIVVASKASGSGAGGSNKKGGGATGKKKLSEMSATEEAQFANEHPEEYRQMVEAEASNV